MEHIYSCKLETSRYCVSISSSQPEELDTWLDEIILKCRANTSDDLIIPETSTPVAEWADHRDNSKGTKLKNWMESNELERVDTGPSPLMSPRAGTQLSTTCSLTYPASKRHVRSHCKHCRPSPNHWIHQHYGETEYP